MDPLLREPVVIVPRRRRGLSPPQLIVLSFAAAAAVGTLLLRLPVAHAPGARVGWLEALFTATSAICVTGLTVVDTGTGFNAIGQAVILALIQVGGLGILTVGTLLAFVTGRRLHFRERLNLQTQLSAVQVGGVVRLVRRIAALVVTVELAGALLLYPRMSGGEAGAWPAVFHSVSAFNNAGFSLHADSLVRYVGDPLVNAVILGLVVLGGLGFVVIVNLIARYRQAQRVPLSLHTKLALTATALLIGLAAMLVLALEWTNPRTLGAVPVPVRPMAAVFQSITPRTAGFNTVDYASMHQATLVVTMLLMFIGGNPGSTAGGIKTVTFVVLVGSAWSLSRGRGELQVFGRRVPVETAVRAGVVTLVGAMLVTGGLAFLSITDPGLGMLPLAFETFSAFGTVGLSMGITPDLSPAGKLIIIVLMFVGRLGPLTLGLALLEAPPERRIQYPAEDVVVG
ncbi:MAG TPA: TrkH family potassium uptake protein [Methylomirabilota bacterium]